MEKNNKRIVLGISILVAFIFLTLSISLYFDYQQDTRKESRLESLDVESMTIEEVKNFLEQRRETEPYFHSLYLLPFIAFIGLFIGILVYYIMADKISHKEKSLEKNTKVILNFLTGQERQIIKSLIADGGVVPQYKLSHLPNLNKVKTHRILINLEQKGVIHKEKIGKINRIILNEELYNVLK